MRRDPELIGNLSAASSFMNESLGPLRKRKESLKVDDNKKTREWVNGKPLLRGRVTREVNRQVLQPEFPDRKTTRRSLVAEKSYDHEVHYIMGQECIQKHSHICKM